MSCGVSVDYNKVPPAHIDEYDYNMREIVEYFNDKYAINCLGVTRDNLGKMVDRIEFLLTETCIMTNEDEQLASRFIAWYKGG